MQSSFTQFFFSLESQKTFWKNTVAAEIGGKFSTFQLNYFKMFFIDGNWLHFECIIPNDISMVFNFLMNFT
jgi:hypothetical protein